MDCYFTFARNMPLPAYLYSGASMLAPRACTSLTGWVPLHVQSDGRRQPAPVSSLGCAASATLLLDLRAVEMPWGARHLKHFSVGPAVCDGVAARDRSFSRQTSGDPSSNASRAQPRQM